LKKKNNFFSLEIPPICNIPLQLTDNNEVIWQRPTTSNARPLRYELRYGPAIEQEFFGGLSIWKLDDKKSISVLVEGDKVGLIRFF
jgi:hypothetical protein